MTNGVGGVHYSRMRIGRVMLGRILVVVTMLTTLVTAISVSPAEAATLPAPTWRYGAFSVSSTTVYGYWDEVSGADSYVVSWTHQGSPLATTTPTTANDRYTYTGLVGAICATVQSRNSSGVGPSSTPRCFTAKAKPSTPRWEVPAITYAGETLSAKWKPASGATKYWVYWTLPNGVKTTKSATSTTGTLPASVSGEYCAKVRSTNSPQYSDFSAQACFTVNGEAAAAPVPSAPVMNSGTLRRDHKYLSARWSAVADADGYQFVWSDDGRDFNEGETTGTAAPSLDYDALDGELCIKVRAENDAGYGPWSTLKCHTANPKPATPPWANPAMTGLSEAVDLDWLAVSGATRYYVFLTKPDGTTRTGNTTSTNLRMTAYEPGQYCGKVMAFNGDRYSPRSAEQCVTVSVAPTTTTTTAPTTTTTTAPTTTTTTKPAPAAPTWSSSGLTSSSEQLSADWNPSAGATSYYVSWTYPDGRRFNSSSTATEQVRRVTAPGQYCATVRAYNGRFSSHSSQRCATFAGPEQLPYPTPAMRLEGNGVIGSWSSIPNVDFFELEWTDDGVVFGPTSAVAVMNGSRADIGANGSGQICLKVKSRGSGDYRDSPWSPASCLQVGATRALPKPTLYPISGTAPSIKVSWIAVANADSYNVQWSDDGANFEPDSGTERSSSVELGSRWGSICVRVQANGSGGFTDSPWSHEKCRSIAQPKLATPVISSATANATNVVFSWAAVPERAEYHWASIRPDGRIVRGATTSTSHTVSIDGQQGNFCLEVRAVLAGRDSELSDRKCTLVQATPPPTTPPPTTPPPTTPPPSGAGIVLPAPPPTPRVDTTPPNWQNNVAGIHFGNVNALPNNYNVPTTWDAALDYDDRDENGVANFKGVDFYEIYLGNTMVTTVQGGSPRQYTFQGLSYGVQHTIRVRAVDDVGNKSRFGQKTVEKASQAAALGRGDDVVTGSPVSVPPPPPNGSNSPGSPTAGPPPVGTNFPSVPSGPSSSGPTNEPSVIDQPSSTSVPVVTPVQGTSGLCGDDGATVLPHDGTGKVRVRWNRTGTSNTDGFALLLRAPSGRVAMRSNDVPARSGGNLHQFVLSNVPDAFLDGDYQYELVAKDGGRTEVCATFRSHQITIRSHHAEDYIQEIAAEIGLTGGLPGNPWMTGTPGDVESMTLRDLTDKQAADMVAAVKRRPSFHSDVQAAERQYKSDDLRYASYLYRMIPLQLMLGSMILADELERKGESTLQRAEGLEVTVSGIEVLEEWRVRPNSGVLRGQLPGVKLSLGILGVGLAAADLVGIVGEVRAMDQSAINSLQDGVEIMGFAVGLYGLLSLTPWIPAVGMTFVVIALGLALAEAFLNDAGRFDFSYSERLSQVNDKKHAAETFALMAERDNLQEIKDKIDRWFFRPIPSSNQQHLVSSRLLWHGSRNTDNGALSIWTGVEPLSNQTYGIGMAIYWNTGSSPANISSSTVLNPGNHASNYFWEIGNVDNFRDIHNPENKPLLFGNVNTAWSAVGSQILSHCASTAGSLSQELCDAARR